MDFGYDGANHLIRTGSAGSPTTLLAYDPLERLRRTQGTLATQFLYDGDDLVAEYDDGGTLLRRYLPGPGTDETLAVDDTATERQYLYTDALGSAVALADGGGTVARINSYGPFGEPRLPNTASRTGRNPRPMYII